MGYPVSATRSGTGSPGRAAAGAQAVPVLPPRCPPGLVYSVELDKILRRFLGTSLLWLGSPGRPTAPVSSDYEDGYRGEQRARAPCPTASSCWDTPGSPMPISLQGTRWLWASLMATPKPKVRLGGAGDRGWWAWGTPGLQSDPASLPEGAGQRLCQDRGPVHLCALMPPCHTRGIPVPTPVPGVSPCPPQCPSEGTQGLSFLVEYVVGVPNKSNTRGEVSAAECPVPAPGRGDTRGHHHVSPGAGAGV